MYTRQQGNSQLISTEIGASVELSVKYAKSVIELDAAQLILDTD